MDVREVKYQPRVQRDIGNKNIYKSQRTKVVDVENYTARDQKKGEGGVIKKKREGKLEKKKVREREKTKLYIDTRKSPSMTGII